ncbi:MAG TPA: Cd(II)/Pb(II)-responsive transcriptional regulator, partial [Burkholderiaceae bacterium]|nr:Cd(II)/Pb(II)-responsive transcriptional regulator [Burkholderiaceae bacterium]
MKIGDLAKATQTPVATIRYYERQGLVPAPARTGSNYRSYGPAHVQRLAFVRRCRALDMSLDEVWVLLRFQDQHPSATWAPADCSAVHTVLDEHLAHVTLRVRELRQLEKHLRELRAHCGSAQSGPACGILEQLNTTAAARDLPGHRPVARQVPGGRGGIELLQDAAG